MVNLSLINALIDGFLMQLLLNIYHENKTNRQILLDSKVQIQLQSEFIPMSENFFKTYNYMVSS